MEAGGSKSAHSADATTRNFGRNLIIRAICFAILHGLRVEKLLEILHEDDELLVINKPAGLVCHPTKDGPLSSLIGRVRLHLGAGSRPHLVNRLDRETSGVTLAAKTDAVARELRRLWESREVEKEYLAIVHGHVVEDHGIIDAPLGKDESSRVAIKDCVRADGLPSQTEFFVERKFSRLVAGAGNKSSVFSLLRVRPRTGRKHQIRIHLAHFGHPIVGDKIYGGDEDLYLSLVEGRLDEEQKRMLILPYQALHARAVRFNWRGQWLEFSCEPEKWFVEFCEADGKHRRVLDYGSPPPPYVGRGDS
jgi:23S rRNA pseudouridine1911/1915/1917 synthase